MLFKINGNVGNKNTNKLIIRYNKIRSNQPRPNKQKTTQRNSTNNENMPWIFKPSEAVMTISTGQYYTATFYVKNTTNKKMTAQAVPSVAPSNAAAHLKKLECFCFEQQELMPGEEALLPVKLLVSDELPENIENIILSYTIFDVTDYNNLELTNHHNENDHHHNGHEMESSL